MWTSPRRNTLNENTQIDSNDTLLYKWQDNKQIERQSKLRDLAVRALKSRASSNTKSPEKYAIISLLVSESSDGGYKINYLTQVFSLLDGTVRGSRLSGEKEETCPKGSYEQAAVVEPACLQKILTDAVAGAPTLDGPAQPPSRPPVETESAPERAKAEAEAIVRQARSEAENIRQKATSEAEQTRQKANSDAEQTRQKASIEAAQEKKRIVNDAQLLYQIASGSYRQLVDSAKQLYDDVERIDRYRSQTRKTVYGVLGALSGAGLLTTGLLVGLNETRFGTQDLGLGCGAMQDLSCGTIDHKLNSGVWLSVGATGAVVAGGIIFALLDRRERKHQERMRRAVAAPAEAAPPASEPVIGPPAPAPPAPSPTPLSSPPQATSRRSL
ncbi:MAG: hypothetical protein U1A78_39090 [Polyangia bacterium]